MHRETTCPSCGATFTAAGDAAGKGACPRCGAPIRLPESPEPTAIREGVPPGLARPPARCPFCDRALPQLCLFCPYCEKPLGYGVGMGGNGAGDEGTIHRLVTGPWGMVLGHLGVLGTILGVILAAVGLAARHSPRARSSGMIILGVLVATWIFAYVIAPVHPDEDVRGSRRRFASQMLSAAGCLLVIWLGVFVFLLAVCVATMHIP